MTWHLLTGYLVVNKELEIPFRRFAFIFRFGGFVFLPFSHSLPRGALLTEIGCNVGDDLLLGVSYNASPINGDNGPAMIVISWREEAL